MFFSWIVDPSLEFIKILHFAIYSTEMICLIPWSPRVAKAVIHAVQSSEWTPEVQDTNEFQTELWYICKVY